MRRASIVLSVMCVSMCVAVDAAGADPQPGHLSKPPELGAIAWHRDFAQAASMARTHDKPLLVLFQEVPGCATCKNYGSQVLSHPLLVEAAETLFVPVAVFNNIKGPDEQLLKSFKEPAWNNPVVRIMSADRRPLTARLSGDYSVAGLAGSMTTALSAAKREVPRYLSLLAEEQRYRRSKLQNATFAMHCFWEGEAALGNVPGVVETMPGFLNQAEVVELQFDPQTISYVDLVKRAQKLKCTARVFARTDDQQTEARELVGSAAVRSDQAAKPDKAPKYYLSTTPLKHVPMTSLQASRVNAALGQQRDPGPYLSQRQLELYRLVQKHPRAPWPDAIGQVITQAWRDAQRVSQGL